MHMTKKQRTLRFSALSDRKLLDFLFEVLAGLEHDALAGGNGDRADSGGAQGPDS